MKRLSILIFLLLLNLTVLFGQTGINSQGDTIVCYTTEEARKIATKLVQSNECNELLIATEKEVKLQENIIIFSKDMILNLDSISRKQNIIIVNETFQTGGVNNWLLVQSLQQSESIEPVFITHQFIDMENILDIVRFKSNRGGHNLFRKKRFSTV